MATLKHSFTVIMDTEKIQLESFRSAAASATKQALLGSNEDAVSKREEVFRIAFDIILAASHIALEESSCDFGCIG